MKFIALLGSAAAAMTISTETAKAAETIENPEFEIAIPGEPAELRRYASMIAAEVRVTAPDTDTASSMGFMPLANYIFGNNRPGETISMTAPVTTTPVTERGNLSGGGGEKIAMTAPVTTAPSSDGNYTVRFMMPSEWTMDTLPVPDDDRISLVKVAPRHVVVAGFTGAKDIGSIQQAEVAITAFIVANRLTPSGPFAIAGYSAPSVPIQDRKWEVQRPVETP